MDCKYNQITPPLEAFLARHEVKVIHLVRRDRLAAYYSGELHTWCNKHPGDDAVPTFCFLLDQYRAIEEEVEMHKRRLGHLTDLRLYYEDLTNNEDTVVLPERAGRMICDLAQVDVRQLTAPSGKEAPANYLGHLKGVPINLIDEATRANTKEPWLW